MKVYEFCMDLRLSGDGNAYCDVNVKTKSIGEKYGSMYHGQLVRFGGVSGRVNDIPAYLGGEDVISVREEALECGQMKYTLCV